MARVPAMDEGGAPAPVNRLTRMDADKEALSALEMDQDAEEMDRAFRQGLDTSGMDIDPVELARQHYDRLDRQAWETLKSPRQRRFYARRSENRRLAGMDHAQKAAERLLDARKHALLARRMDSAVETAVTSGGPGQAARAIEQFAAETAALDPGRLPAFLADAVARSVLGLRERGRSGTAEALLAGFKNRIPGDIAAGLETSS